MTAASLRALGVMGAPTPLADGAASRCPCGHLETEHGSGDPHRGCGAVDEASVQSCVVRGGNGSGDRARAPGADADRDIRCGERRCIRCSGHSLLRRQNCGDRQHEREQHEHRSDDRHREDGPGAPLTRHRVAGHLPPSNAQLDALTVNALISPTTVDPRADAVTQTSSPRCSTRRFAPLTIADAAPGGSPRATLRAAVAATC